MCWGFWYDFIFLSDLERIGIMVLFGFGYFGGICEFKQFLKEIYEILLGL